MNLFAAADHEKLVGPARLFDPTSLEAEHGEWGNQLLRAASAIRMSWIPASRTT